jgi:hypothetical protein
LNPRWTYMCWRRVYCISYSPVSCTSLSRVSTFYWQLCSQPPTPPHLSKHIEWYPTKSQDISKLGLRHSKTGRQHGEGKGGAGLMSDRLPSLPVARMAAWQCDAFVKYFATISHPDIRVKHGSTPIAVALYADVFICITESRCKIMFRKKVVCSLLVWSVYLHFKFHLNIFLFYN